MMVSHTVEVGHLVWHVGAAIIRWQRHMPVDPLLHFRVRDLHLHEEQA